MQLSEKLVHLGFSKNKASVYVALVDLGQCKASEIIKKIALHRNIVYEALDELVAGKLAFKTTKGGVALFQLSDAATLIDAAKQQLTTAQEVTREINKARNRSQNEVKIYEGVSGLRAHRDRVFAEIGDAPTHDELLVLGENAEAEVALYESFWKDDDARRSKKQIPLRILYSHGNRDFLEDASTVPYTQARFLPQQIKNPIMIDIWKENIGIMTYDSDPFIISIKNKKLADSFREYFEALWNQDVQVVRGSEAIQQFVMEPSLEYTHNWFIGGNGGIHRVMPEYWEEYNARRIAQGTWWHDLVDVNMTMPGIQEFPPGVQDPQRCYEFKWLPEDVSSPSVIFMYGHTVANIIWEADPEPIAFVIQNKDVFEGYYRYFEYLWNQDTRVVSGLAAVQELFYTKMRAMKKGEECCVLWGTYGKETQQEMQPWFITYNTERIQRGIRLQLLMFEDDRKTVVHEMSAAGDPDFRETELRFVSEANYGSPMQINMYPDSVVMFYWGIGENATAVEISKKEIRDAMRAYFDGIWVSAKK